MNFDFFSESVPVPTGHCFQSFLIRFGANRSVQRQYKLILCAEVSRDQLDPQETVNVMTSSRSGEI